MKPEIKERWIKALESGDYKFGKYRLRNRDPNCFCAGGVLCDLHSKETGNVWYKGTFVWGYFGNKHGTPAEVLLWAGLTRDDIAIIEDKNDDSNDFTEAIKYIKEQL